MSEKSGANGSAGGYASELDTMSRHFSTLIEQNQSMMDQFFKQTHQLATQSLDPLNVGTVFGKAGTRLSTDPQQLMQSNYDLWRDHARMWQEMSERFLRPGDDDANKMKGDRRFRHEDWDQNPIFDFIKRSYLITSRWLIDTMSNIEGLEDHERDKVIFHTKLLADAFSPTNFIMTNPEVIRTMMETNGQSLIKGMQNLQRDLDPKTGRLQIMMSDPDAFVLGKNIATTPGKVVYQNEIMQLIQYSPTTEKVYRRPLVIVPPWINKYYILDLQEKNSFVRWAVAQGHTVFLISWVNPDGELGERKEFEDYMKDGVLDALDAVEQATGVKDVTMIGYCIGGTLLAATLAYMAEKKDERVKAVTFFTTQTDFSEAGDLKIFTDEAQVDNLERMMDEKGYLEGNKMAMTFNMLRANDLIWSFYVDNYLLGKDPLKFDLLYWNADSTRMPKKTHLYYLRQMYLQNNLAKPGGITLDGVPIDLGKVEVPTYIQASKEDHIAPYKSVFKSVGLLGGEVKFMLAGSGHIAGVINPPSAEKYNYWTNDDNPEDLDAWLAGAEETKGSWWPDWDKWLKKYAGQKVNAREPGDGKLDVIEDAPGSYVKTKA